MTDETRLAQIEARLKAATPGPWAWANTGEKCYGANVGAEVIAEDDEEAEHPLAGDLSDREDDYQVLQPIAELSHQNCARDAEFIADAPADIAWLIAQHTTLRARVRELETALRDVREEGQCRKADYNSDTVDAITAIVDAALLVRAGRKRSATRREDAP